MYILYIVVQALGDYDGHGISLHLIDLPAKLYRKQLAKVTVAGTLSEWFRVKKGVRQGCVFSPYLFNILAEMVMREISRWTTNWRANSHELSLR